MSASIETLSSLERRIQLTLPSVNVRQAIDGRLKKLARTVKMPGFRPGKVPLKMVEQSYGPQVENEILNEQLGRAFSEAVQQNQLRVAGLPSIEPVNPPADSQALPETLQFTATFEVYPEIKLGDLGTLAIEKSVVNVGDAEVDQTIDVMRKQRATYTLVERAAADGDKVTIDFVGKIEGVEFAGGAAQDFDFVIGQKQMLADFETGVLGARAGEIKSVNVSFPEDYHGKEVAGKTAVFEITVKQVQGAELPALDQAFVQSLGIASGAVEDLRQDVRANLQREINHRLSQRNKNAVMEALSGAAELDIPKALIQQEAERMAEEMKAQFQQRGGKADMTIPADIFKPQAEKSVRLGLIVAELVKREKLEANPEQIKARVEEFAQSYEKPEEVVRWYYNDLRRLDNVRAVVLEDNVVDFVLARATVTQKTLSFDEIMAQQQQ
ncbi:trigger factor [Parvibium lacunae]|uniref:Trigger factor n=1 Tax=Parvibium lacunae TaxID=1888893 RepID=A0A368L884_9BURK|nr:trigger factor [Parvibium lacunae]RCS59814.1 trigger factor [Parvibium lacunae]